MNKTFFIIPGFGETGQEPVYKDLKKFIGNKGFLVKTVSITWARHTITDYTKEFKAIFNKEKSKNNTVLGFSYGAVTAFLTAEELKINKLILCSLSPTFKEDLISFKGKEKTIIGYLGKRRFNEISILEGVKTAKNLTIPTTILYGEKESARHPQLKKRAEQTAQYAKHAQIVFVPSADHDIADPEYLKQIKVLIK